MSLVTQLTPKFEMSKVKIFFLITVTIKLSKDKM